MPYARPGEGPGMSAKDERLKGTRARRIMQRLERVLASMQVPSSTSDTDTVFGPETRPTPVVTTHPNELLSLAAYGPNTRTGQARKNIPFEALVHRLKADARYILQVYAVLTEMTMGIKGNTITVERLLHMVRAWLDEARNNPHHATY